MIRIITFISIVLLIKLFINLSRLIEIKRLFRLYKKWSDKYEIDITEKTSQIIELFKNAGISDKTLRITRGIIGRSVERINVSVFENIFLLDRNVTETVCYTFKEAIGIYKRRIINSISLRYWIEVIVFFPQKFIQYLHIAIKDDIIKIFQVIYWIISTILIIYTLLEKI